MEDWQLVEEINKALELLKKNEFYATDRETWEAVGFLANTMKEIVARLPKKGE